MKSNRREFFKKLSIAATAPYIVPSSVFGQNSPNNKMTIAFIGTGNNGYNWLDPFMRDDRSKVVAVCDVNKEGPGYWDNSVRGREPARRKVDKFYDAKVCDVYSDYREVLERSDIDAIYIGTPDHWHAKIAIEAANVKKDIYGQKPLSLTIAEGRAMADAVKKNNIIWQTGSPQRSDHNFRRVCELVHNGRIGKLHTVRCGLPGGRPDFGKVKDKTEPQPVPDGFNYEMWLGPAPKSYYCPARVGVNFRWCLDYSGGQLTDWGGHHPDIAQWGMGTDDTGPIIVKNAEGKFPPHPVYNTATEYYFECIYRNGVKLIVSNKEKGGVTFEGDEGWVWANRGNHDASSKEILNSEIGEDEIHLYKSDDHVTNFIDCVFSRKQPICPAETGHRSITIAHLGNIALLTGRDLVWNPEAEQIIGDPGANDMLSRPYREPWSIKA